MSYHHISHVIFDDTCPVKYYYNSTFFASCDKRSLIKKRYFYNKCSYQSLPLILPAGGFMFLGIDCGTQGTKVLLWNEKTQKVMTASYNVHKLISHRHSQKEQNPHDWLDALQAGIKDVLARAHISPKEVNGIGVSGQQHGLVILDKNDVVIRPAKLWCDTECESQLQHYLHKYEETYQKKLSDVLGIQIPVAFTLGKLLWIKENERFNFNKIAKILLPHEYINFFLTGQYCAEPGDASGTGYFDTVQKTWCKSAVDLIEPSLYPKLPRIIQSHQPHGYLSEKAARLLGLNKGIVVSSGGGDNMMSAIGTGNIAEGQLTMSLGTSGTLSTCQKKQIDSNKHRDINTFCSSSGSWLPLVSTMNVTNAINSFRQLMDISFVDFENYLKASVPGAEGLSSFPWLNGARLPNLPGITGSLTGMTMVNFTKPHLLRAVVEGVTFNLCRGIDIFNKCNLRFDRINLIGGGSNSPTWCQMIADITGINVAKPLIPDAAALGAAIQAHWCFCVSINDEPNELEYCIPDFLKTTSTSIIIIEPNSRANDIYKDIYDAYHAAVDKIKIDYLNR
ncbi:xylulokinase [Brenneria populi]|uniref:Xylulose kinase n=1 Tax=Brenneria populi TaxID=1505588 RepID=A0ABU6JM12_9GAMM|nr:xylulokinase [Brenneria populi Li et al. 2015]